MAVVFISYASASNADAQRIADAVRGLGYPVWRDNELPPHRDYSEVIEEQLRAAKAVIVVWSANAVQSQWVRAEADFARDKRKLVQVSLDGALPPMPFNQIQCADLSHWRGEPDHPQWLRVAGSLTQLIGGEFPQTAFATQPPVASAPQPRLKLRLWGIAGLAALILLGSGLWVARERFAPAASASAERVAVLPFSASGGAQAEGFADGLLDEMLGALNTGQLRALSRTDSLALRGTQADAAVKRLDVGLFIDGSVRQDGELIKARVYLNDARDHTTLWSHDFETAAAEADALQAQIAARATDVAHWALIGRAKGSLDSASLADFVEATDEVTGGGGRSEMLIRRVIAKYPKLSQAYSRLAVAMRPAPGQTGQQFLAAQRAQLEHALVLDPRNGEALMLLAEQEPLGAWRKRWDLLTNATAVEPDFAPSWHMLSKFLAEAGRNREALAAALTAFAANSMFIGSSADVCGRQTQIGAEAEAKAECDRVDKLFPGESFNDGNQFFFEVGAGRYQSALNRLTHPNFVTRYEGPAGAEAWTRFIKARQMGVASARTEALAAAKAADAGTVHRLDAYLMLALMGEVDAALDQGRKYYSAERLAQPYDAVYPDSSILFFPSTANVRRDPGFMALTAQANLNDFWRATGKWPDFCSEPGLTYDCRAEAQRLKSGARAAER